MSPTVFIKILHLVAMRYYMVPTQGGISFPLEYGLFYCLLLLPGIMSDQNTTMLAQPPHLSDHSSTVIISTVSTYTYIKLVYRLI